MTGILFFYRQAGQRYREELGLARVAARGEHARNLRTHDHRRQFAAAEVRDRLEEDVGRFEVGEEQAVGIARDGRTLDFLVLGDLLVERYVQRQRSVDDRIAQLSAVAHFGQDGPFGRRRNARQHLFRGCDAGDFRRVDAQQPGSLDEVSDQLLFLFEVGRGDHRDVRDAEQFGKRRHFENGHVAQHALGREETRILVQDAAHVFVGRDESLHQDVGVARHDGRDGQPHAVDVALFIHDLEDRTVDPLGPADLFDDLFVAVEGRFDQSLIICVVDGAERVGILAVGDGQPFAALFLGLLDDLREFCNHCCMKVRIKRFGRCFPLPVSGTAAGRLCRSVGECEPASLPVESKFFHRCGIIGII